MILADTDVLIDYLAGIEPLASRMGDVHCARPARNDHRHLL